ncbi:anti-phage dCTP deaminase [Pseudomonas sp. CC120222-01a]|uniref:anti-phage dCTP deaminase n=1 Tax=Pseudomonas sp. CC120222-01a TaxID=1378075 RepID=UPI000D93C9D9|nr:anti-phage dCTP deaminase [Pseudomonas sp. CC120222-01a]PVZ39333.1 deoxycytidylate deaminase [Pseudomonas sp. CC120222-01a]
MRFEGSYEELQEKLIQLNAAGVWKVLNPNQYQFRSNSGGVLNWYPSTRNMTFQGKPSAADELEILVSKILGAEEGPQSLDSTQAAGEAIKKLSAEESAINSSFLDDSYSDSELVIGLVGAIGTDLRVVCQLIEERLKAFSYVTQQIKISSDVISMLGEKPDSKNEFERIDKFMAEGNRLRKECRDNSVLALGAAAVIGRRRAEMDPRRNAYIINSLKSPYEVQRLRKIYAGGFFLIGVHADYDRRHEYLAKDLRMSETEIANLVSRDENEKEEFGQHTRDTYHLSDFFISYDGNHDALKQQVWRVLNLLFGKPYVTPTFDEYAMFMAFSASLRSADLSRQVGAVIAKENCIVATGANDVPRAEGGLYWPEINASHEIVDAEDGRDYMRGEDSNAAQKKAIIDQLIKIVPENLRAELAPLIRSSSIKDITEYGRVVHAEMEALLSSSRTGVSPLGSTLYCTTFPCHNCAKHIIAAGIKRVVYVEPYPKSKALQFHSDAITTHEGSPGVFFEPFMGVGPRSFFDLFSTNLGSGYPVIRKTDEGQVVDWREADARLRTQMLPCSYIEREFIASTMLSTYLKEKPDERL